jgi:hypothetical protein
VALISTPHIADSSTVDTRIKWQLFIGEVAEYTINRTNVCDAARSAHSPEHAPNRRFEFRLRGARSTMVLCTTFQT